MRVFPLARRGLVVAVAVALVGSGAAQADDPSVGELQVRLVESRQHLNRLYAESAMASERLNGAVYELEQAQARLADERAVQKKTAAQMEVVRRDVEALTVEQAQTGSVVQDLVTLVHSDGTEELLGRSSAQTAEADALAARLDAFTARKTVNDAAVRATKEATADLEAARDEQDEARAGIDTSIAAAEKAEASTRRERSELLQQLATAQGTTVKAVTRAQDDIDERLDESGPDAPAVTSPTPDPEPSPEPTRPSTRPSAPDPKPTTPKPADPPPASSSKVDKAIAFAKAQLGEPYKWAGAGPGSWDCSGLTMRAWQAAGVDLSHYAGSQYTATKKVSVGSIKRGDLLFWSNGGAGSIYHVAMYLGDGKMIHAPRPGRSVEIVPISYWIRPDLASRPG